MKDREKVMLIIEDDTETVLLFRLMFRQSKVKIVVKTNGEESLAAVENFKPDLVLLDIMLPGMDGWEIYKRMKASPAHQLVPIIVVSARPEYISRLYGQAFDAVEDYVTKPFSPRSLVALVERYLASSPPAAPLLGGQVTTL